METGKLSTRQLQRMLAKYTGYPRKEVILAGKLGEDCTFVNIGSHTLVLTMDPVTAAQADQGNIGFHINMNDLATSGARPLGIMVTLLLPEGSTEATLDEIMGQLHKLCVKHQVQILGGHTEVTDSVKRPILTITALGTTPRGEEIYSQGVEAGASLVVSKTLGIEGTLLMAQYLKCEGRIFTRAEEETLARFQETMSVIEEGKAGRQANVLAMHDITEGGVLGATWEMVQGKGFGCQLKQEDFPFDPLTLKFAQETGLDPHRLISSGSMLFATHDPDRLIKELEERGIQGKTIGTIVEEQEAVMIHQDGTSQEIDPPRRDEIYRLYD